MISKRALKLIQLCRCDIFNLKSASLCNRQRFLENSIATSSTNYRGKISASEALKIQNDFFLQEKEKYEDTFGNIENFELRYQRVKDDPDDIKEYERVKQGQGKLIKEYIKEIQSHLENNQVSSSNISFKSLQLMFPN